MMVFFGDVVVHKCSRRLNVLLRVTESSRVKAVENAMLEISEAAGPRLLPFLLLFYAAENENEAQC